MSRITPCQLNDASSSTPKTTTLVLIVMLAVGLAPGSAAFAGNAGYLAVAALDAARIDILDIEDGSLVTTYSTGTIRPADLSYDPLSKRIAIHFAPEDQSESAIAFTDIDVCTGLTLNSVVSLTTDSVVVPPAPASELRIGYVGISEQPDNPDPCGDGDPVNCNVDDQYYQIRAVDLDTGNTLGIVENPVPDPAACAVDTCPYSRFFVSPIPNRPEEVYIREIGYGLDVIHVYDPFLTTELRALNSEPGDYWHNGLCPGGPSLPVASASQIYCSDFRLYSADDLSPMGSLYGEGSPNEAVDDPRLIHPAAYLSQPEGSSILYWYRVAGGAGHEDEPPVIGAVDTTSNLELYRFPVQGSQYDSDFLVDAASQRAFIAQGHRIAVVDLVTHAQTSIPSDQVFAFVAVDTFGSVCGDASVVEGCEECDDGNELEGDGCDTNCTMSACGNAIAGGDEECDDGNDVEHDFCRTDCTLNVCGDGVVRYGHEQCDDGGLIDGDGCSSACALPPEIVQVDVLAGEAVTTDLELDGATATDPVETTVTAAVDGDVRIEEGAAQTQGAAGFTFLGQNISISIPAGTAASPIRIRFELDSSQLPPGSDATFVEVSRNGVPVGDCTAPAPLATPDPCLESAEIEGDGDLVLLVRTSSASEWAPLAPAHDASISSLRPVKLRIAPNRASAATDVRFSVANSDPVEAGATRLAVEGEVEDCPFPLTLNLPDFEPQSQLYQNSHSLPAQETSKWKAEVAGLRFQIEAKHVDAPVRCRLKLSVDAVVAENVDPAPDDNTAFLEIDMFDANASESSTTSDLMIRSVRPKRIKVSLRRPVVDFRIPVKIARTRAGTGEIVADVELVDGDCPSGMLQTIDSDKSTDGNQPTVSLAPGAKLAGEIRGQVNFATLAGLGRSKLRCRGFVQLNVPPVSDEEPTDNSAQVVLDVVVTD